MIPLHDSQKTYKFPFWTYLLIAINIFVFYQEFISPNPDGFITQYALIPSMIDFSNLQTLYPFITNQFLHAGIIHILSNMWFLKIFGDNVEERMGFIIFPLFYLLAGIAAGLAQYIIASDSQIPMLGASGAVAGVLGAYFAMFPHHKVSTLVPIFGLFTIINLPASLMLIYWFITQLFSGTASLASTSDVGGVAWFAHIGGFATGWIIAKLFPKRPILEPVY